MDPITASITIDRPREEVFDYLADIANHPEFSDHYLTQWHLLRVESYGRGAGARFKIEAPLDRFAWGDMTFIDVERPFKITAAGRSGEVQPQEDVDHLDARAVRLRHAGRGHHRVRAHAPDRQVHRGGHPPPRLDQAQAAAGRMQRMQSILEEDIDRGARATVGGL